MANCLLLLNDGTSNVLLNDGSSKVLLNDDTCGVVVPTPEGGGGGAGVGRSTQKGVSIYDVDQSIPPKKHLRPEWPFEVRATLIKEEKNLFDVTSRYVMSTMSSNFKVVAEKLSLPVEALRSMARFRTPMYKEMYLKSKFKIPELTAEWESKWDYRKIIKLLESYISLTENKNEFSFIESHEAWNVLTEAIPPTKMGKIWNELSIPDRRKMLSELNLDGMLAKSDYVDLPAPVRKTFEDSQPKDLKVIFGLILAGSGLALAINILDSPIDTPINIIKDMPDPTLPGPVGKDPPNISITAPSSFIGIVTYNPTFQTMDMKLKNRTYSWCHVPQRIFDGFKGASSKGAFFNRAIKGQYDC